MKKSTLVILIVAASLTVGGLVLGAVAIGMGAYEGSLSDLSTQPMESNTHNVFVPVSGIDIDVPFADVRFIPSNDENIRVSAHESKKQYYEVSVVNDTLKIRYYDIRMWYERIGIQINEDNYLTVYLPAGEYDTLTVENSSGEISVPSDYTFGDVKLTTASGEINFKGKVTNMLDIHTASGEVNVNDLHSDSAQMSISVASGDVDVENTTLKSISISSASGEMELNMCDAEYIELKSASGEIEAALLSGKTFYTDTSSGKVRVPSSSEGAPECRCKTSSGDITIRVVGG